MNTATQEHGNTQKGGLPMKNLHRETVLLRYRLYRQSDNR